MKAELDEMTSIIMEYDTADYGGFTLTNVKEIAERYARIQIEKDRERVVNEVVKWKEHDCNTCACSCRGDLVINSNADIIGLPIILD